MTIYIDDTREQQLLLRDTSTKIDNQKERDGQLSCRKFDMRVSNNIIKRKALRKLVKENSKCHHKHIYTEANAICKRISLSYKAQIITAEHAMKFMLQAREQMSHHNMPKRIVCRNMHALLDKI
jgi:hypothetical protein